MATTEALRPVDQLDARTLTEEVSRLESQDKLSKQESSYLLAARAELEDRARRELEQQPAAELAGAERPDRPEGAADDDTSAISQEQREQAAEWDFEGDEPATADTAPPDGEQFTTSSTEHTAPAGETTSYEPGQEEPINGEITAEQAQRMRDAAGLTAEEAEARGEQPALDGAGEAGIPPEPTEYDLKVWEEIVGGQAPTDRKIAIKGLPSLTLENGPAVLKKGQELELRVKVRVTGFASTDKLKHNPDTEELELTDTTEKRTLTVLAAAVVE